MPPTNESGENFGAYLDLLRWAVIDVEAFPSEGGGAAPPSRPKNRRERPGFLVHSLLGPALREAACAVSPRCARPCAEPETCVYGRLFEPRPRATGVPLGNADRVPSPVVVQAPWERWERSVPLAFRVVLLGEANAEAHIVGGALRSALARGVGGDRVRMGATASIATRVGGEIGGGGRTLDLRFETPLVLKRSGGDRRQFRLEDLVKDLSFRLSTWGCHLQGLPWQPRSTALFEEVAEATMVGSELRWERSRRFSSRQNREIALHGHLGDVRVEGAGPLLRRVLSFAEVCGAGKGTSVGHGVVRVAEVDPSRGAEWTP